MSDQQGSGELKTARTLNTVAMIGGAHAAYQAAEKIPGAAKVKSKVGSLVPKAVKSVAESAPKLGTKGKFAAAAIPVGWVGFHGAELAGDVMSRRAINAQSKQTEDSGLSKAYISPRAGANGHGRRITEDSPDLEVGKSSKPMKPHPFGIRDMSPTGEDVNITGTIQSERTPKKIRRGAAVGGGISGAVLGGVAGATPGILANHGRLAAIGAGAGAVAGAAGLAANAHHSTKYRPVGHITHVNGMTREEWNAKHGHHDPVKNSPTVLASKSVFTGLKMAGNGGRAISRTAATGGAPRNAGLKEMRRKALADLQGAVQRDTTGSVTNGVHKARRFDPEADRQRRTGLIAGLAGGAGIVAGEHTGRTLTTRVEEKGGGGAVHGLAFKPKMAKKGSLLALGTAAAAGTAAGAYKHGISERNKPWT